MRRFLVIIAMLLAACNPPLAIPEVKPGDGPARYQSDDPSEESSEEPSAEPSDNPSEGPSEDAVPKAPEHFPQVRIYTDDKQPVTDRETYIPGKVTFMDEDGTYCKQKSLDGRMKIKGRGNSTWEFFPKKPYRIKLDEKQPVFGLHADKDWILLADYSDKSLLHNRFAMEISKVCGMYWTPAMRSVEVYFNDDYIGVYTFAEHKEVNGHKVDISDQGVYLEIGEEMNEPVCFMTGMGIPLMFQEPEQPTDEQLSATKQRFKDFEAALDVPWKGLYREYIDIDSFVNYFIVEELSKNPDGNLRRSSYITLDTDGKITFYHVWDFDLAFGNCDFFGSLYGIDASPNGWFIKYYNREGPNRGWYWKLFQDPFFVSKVKKRWQEVMPSLKDLMSYPEEQAVFLSGVQENNFRRWPIMGQYVWPNANVAKTYEGEIYNLWTFYHNRLYWMDSQISNW